MKLQLYKFHKRNPNSSKSEYTFTVYRDGDFIVTSSIKDICLKLKLDHDCKVVVHETSYSSMESNVTTVSELLQSYDAMKEEYKLEQEENVAKRAVEQRELDEKLKAYRKKRELDPKTDEIPASEYAKLAKCKKYPLRKSCNYGETDTTRWERCEHMDYVRTGDIGQGYWRCTA